MYDYSDVQHIKFSKKYNSRLVQFRKLEWEIISKLKYPDNGNPKSFTLLYDLEVK